MPPKETEEATSLEDLLQAVADQEVPGKLNKRAEFAIDEVLDAAVAALAEEREAISGARELRSATFRMVVAKGLVAILAERTRRARRAGQEKVKARRVTRARKSA